jgi:hypothetical protein
MTASKKAFDTNTVNIPVFYPDELRIVGGLELVDPRERGPLDTGKPAKPTPLYNPTRLACPLKEGFVESVDLHGIISPPSIVGDEDGVPAIKVGRSRIRGARVVNYERRKKLNLLNGKSDRAVADKCLAAGLPLRSVKCDGRKKVSSVQILSEMIAENHMRTDDDFATTIALAQTMLDETNNEFDLVAREFGVTPTTLKLWLSFEEKATPETKAAMQAGRLSLTAAALLAREEKPDEQNKQLAELLSAPDQTVRRAANISRKGKGGKGRGGGANPFHGKKELVKFGGFYAQEAGKGAFVEGVLALIALQTTGKTDDPRLADVFKQFEGA